ncbi:TonB-dependent receptor plug domain-containing protein [Methylocucumis oryzae]|uniref:TonB-dependent receptor plug domain-containing protein n=1 Tax=Methylocucumis oryzae TaxID=1632867 RepID=UPI001EF9F5AC|nr:TonB-dependent receptor plug domain-containing protein [Methylocucumis oryzae]
MKSHITIFLIASTYPVISAAQSSIDSSLITPLPDVVVTATRVDTPDNQLATGTTVITRQDIDNSQFKTLPDILKTVQGVEISQSGGYGQTTDLFLRGSNPSHVLVLIDGIKVGSITSGTMSYELIPVDQIERIEIIRGPQSSLYGSEAIGGVIQIFTRKADSEQQTRVSLEAGGGTYDTAHVAGSVNGRYGANWFSLGVSNINSQGFNNKQNSDPDADGYDNTGLNARIGHKFSNNAELEAFFYAHTRHNRI